jgi:hypothetical protein
MGRGRPPGHPKTGGRVVGSVNKRSLQAQEKAQKAGVDPMTFCLRLIGDESLPIQMRLDAAIKIMEFIHPKLRQMDGLMNVNNNVRPLEGMATQELEALPTCSETGSED